MAKSYDELLETVECFIEAKKELDPKLDDARHLFRGLFGQIEESIPDGWERVVIYIRYYAKKYEIKFFVKQNGRYKDCYSLPGVNKGLLLKIFDKCSKKWHRSGGIFAGRRLDNIMTFVINNTGSWISHVDYKDDFIHNQDWEDIWEKKYLK